MLGFHSDPFGGDRAGDSQGDTPLGMSHQVPELVGLAMTLMALIFSKRVLGFM